MTNTKLNNYICCFFTAKHVQVCAAVCLLLFCGLACGLSKGQFAYKTFGSDVYKKMPFALEIDAAKPIDWAYTYSSIRGVHQVGVTLQKKELVWVEVETRIETPE